MLATWARTDDIRRAVQVFSGDNVASTRPRCCDRRNAYLKVRAERNRKGFVKKE